jgi:putative hydrolase
VAVDPHQLMEQLKRAADEARTGTGPGGILRLLTPEQRVIFDRAQAMMALLEGHASYVMNQVGPDVIPTLPQLKHALQARRAVRGVESRLQRAIGFDQKVAQYDRGERFVGEIIDRIGMGGFNLVWESRDHLPRPAEIGDPAAWVARVAT